MHHRGAFRVLVHFTHTTLQPALGEFTELCMRHRSVNYAAAAIIKRCNLISMVLCAILRCCQTTRSSDDAIVLLRPVVILTERSTDRPCALDMCNTARSFTHESNTFVIRRLAFLNLGFIDLLPCTALSAALHNLASWNSGLSTNLSISRFCA